MGFDNNINIAKATLKEHRRHKKIKETEKNKDGIEKIKDDIKLKS